MKFDYVIGNPPYQEETDSNGRQPPIYDKFMEGAYTVGDVVELITPARFLFNAGQTPKKWNKKMLDDVHLKVLRYWSNASEVFPSTDIKGGIVVTLRNENVKYDPITRFIPYPELERILSKVVIDEQNPSLSCIVTGGVSYSYTSEFRKDFPDYVKLAGKSFDVRTNAFSKLDDVIYFSEKPDSSKHWVQMLGLRNNQRVYRWVNKKYICGPDNFKHYKVFVPKSNGTGAFGEVLSTPCIGAPHVGNTQTFISIGDFKTKSEAKACLKYVCTKFLRALLDILKTTQDNSKGTWGLIPLQDFTSDSDIDWSQSVSDIDTQLYKKYGLSEDEIDFIETHVKPME